MANVYINAKLGVIKVCNYIYTLKCRLAKMNDFKQYLI